jgi:hypothetical protein
VEVKTAGARNARIYRSITRARARDKQTTGAGGCGPYARRAQRSRRTNDCSDEPLHKPSRRRTKTNRQASCRASCRWIDTPPNRHAAKPSRRTSRRRAESSGELSGRMPPNRRAAESTRRRTESSSELSGRTPGTPPNRVGAKAVAKPNRQASCQAGRWACHRTAGRAVRQVAGQAAEPNRRASRRANSQTRRGTES